MALRLLAIVALASAVDALRVTTGARSRVTMGVKPMEELRKLPAAATALCISTYAQAASAKSVLGVNGALDFGPLAGDQPGGEGTGKALGVNDDSLFGVLLA